MPEHSSLDEKIPSSLDKARAKLEFRLDPRVKALSEEFDALEIELLKMRADSLPKILQLKSGKREYTSIRRLESSGIQRREIPSESENPAFHIIDYSVRADLIGEGQVGAVLIPSTSAADAKDKDLIELLESKESDIERETGWGTALPVALDKGVPFKFNEWGHGTPLYAMVKRVMGELFFVQSTFHHGPNIYTEEKGRRIAIARRVNPDQEGMVTLFRNTGDWWTIAEIEAQRELDQRFATFYVMVEGRSEQKRQEEPRGARKLEPRFSKVTI